MLRRGQTTEQRIAQIADGFKQGLEGYSAGQRRQTDALNEMAKTDLQQEALKRQRAMQTFEVANSIATNTGKQVDPSVVAPMIESGNFQGLGEILKAAPNTPKYDQALEDRKLNKDYKESQIKKNNNTVPALSYEQKLEKKNEIDQQQKIKQANIQDFDLIDPSIIPTTKDAEEVKKLNASNKSYQEIGLGAIEKLKKSDPRNPAYYISNDWKMLQQDLTKMKLQAKNLEDLGVLNGPDLGLVNETLGSINPSTLAMLGPEKAAQRLKASLDTASSVLVNAASARNYRPKGSAASPSGNNGVDPLRAELEQRRALKAQQATGA